MKLTYFFLLSCCLSLTAFAAPEDCPPLATVLDVSAGELQQALSKIRLQIDPFAGAPSHHYGEDEVTSKRGAFTPTGQDVTFRIKSGLAERKAAVDEGRLVEFTPEQLVKLPPGTYTYAVLKDGTIVTGRVLDSFELGVKHVNLAKGREVVGAGELSIAADGKYEFNSVSGHFSRVLVAEKKLVSGEKLGQQLAETLYLRMGHAGTFRGLDQLLPAAAPAQEKIKALCGSERFAGTEGNAEACCTLVSVGCEK